MKRREEILNAVEARLKTLTLSNGYSVNCGHRCDYWHDLPFEYGEAGAITYRDPEEELVEENRVHNCILHMEIEALAFVANPLADSEALVADIRELLSADRNWSGLAQQTRLRKISKTLETQGKTAARVMAEVDINYKVPLFE